MDIVDILDWLKYGVAGLALAAIILVVRMFIDFLTKQTNQFNQIVANHIQHNMETREKLIVALGDLTKAIHEMLGTIRNRGSS